MNMTQKINQTGKRLLRLLILLAVVAGIFTSARPTLAISPDIVISQVYGGGGNPGATYTNDFIELFNRGTTAVNLSGWSVQYTSAAGPGNFGSNSMVITELPPLSLAPGQYLLIQEAQGSGGTTSLPTPDVTDLTPISMSGTAGKVAVVSSTTSLGCNGGSNPCSPAQLAMIVDLVGYGSANFYEGSAAAPGLSSTTADSRNNNGCDETDDNAADFTAGVPNPRNTASPLNLCDGGSGAVDVYINELRISGIPDAEFFELQGDAATSLDGLTYLVISGEFSPGQIDEAIDLTGQSIPADGLFLAADATAESNYGVTADLTTSLNFFGSPTTHLIVSDFTGAVGNDLDSDNDGTLDTIPWTEIVDSVSLIDGDTNTDYSYSNVVVGPDGNFTPAGTYRCDDAPSGTFDNNQLTFGTLDGSPGTSNADQCAVIPPSAKIHEVQGSGSSVAIPAYVRVEAVVVADYQSSDQLRGFFIQEEDGDADADPNTSEGIFVFCGDCATAVSVGDLVQVTGPAEEFFGMSQIDITEPDSAVSVMSSGNALPTAATVDLPASSSTEAEATFENVEGMLVTFSDTLVVSEYFELARYGQLVLTADARPAQFTDANEPGPAGYAAFLADLDSKRIILDDDNNIQNDAISVGPDEPYFWPRPGLSNSSLIRGGDSISSLTGVMHWSFAGQRGTDAWRVRPVDEAFSYNFTSNNARTAAPDAIDGSLRVASFNVLNYFTTIDSRGADSQVELDRQREKIAAAICAMDVDVVGLIEIENNGSVALQDLLNGTNGINANCGPYDYIDTGVIGTDQIAVAFIYNSATVSPVGNYAILDSSVDSRFNTDKNRPALAQTFIDSATGGTMTVVVNHLKSKGSSCNDVGDPDLNDGAANCNATRTLAAEAMVDWLATDPTGSGDEDFLIIGDLNSYRNEDPIDALEEGADDALHTSDDYTDLLDALIGSNAYSYVFDGQLGYLDYALANAGLFEEVSGVTVWHINADEIPIFDYNDDIDDGSAEASFERESSALPIYESNAYRASDHDPVIIGLDVCDEIAPTLSVAVTPDMLWPPNHKYVNVTATVVASDNFDQNPTATLLSATSNEPDNALDDGNTINDIVIVDDTHFKVRAERSELGNGRIYTITYQVTDACGNSTIASAEVFVPISQGD